MALLTSLMSSVASEPETAKASAEVEDAPLGLGAPYPNPAGPSAVVVPYRLAAATAVRMSVMDVLGREVAVLVQGTQPEGEHTARLDAGALAPGVYLVRFAAEGEPAQTRAITVQR